MQPSDLVEGERAARTLHVCWQPPPSRGSGGPVDADPTWSFDRYQAYEDVRFQQSLAEQEQALSGGLVADPKSQPHGGYRIACVWPEEVTASACALSARLAELLPETPAYPYQAVIQVSATSLHRSSAG